MKQRYEIAQENFTGDYNCSQSVLLSFKELIPMNEEQIINCSVGLGGGMGRKGEVCGAVSGGVLALGLIDGKNIEENIAKKDVIYKKVNRLLTEFEEINQSTRCRELLNGIDLTSAEGKEKFDSENMKNEVCMKCIKDAVQLVEKGLNL